MKLRVALVPSYEPDDVLLDVTNELLAKDFTVVVVNDGSGPSYNDVFSRLPREVHYLTYDENHGKGYALKYGLRFIKDNFQDCIVVTLDSDGQHKVSDAIKICDECEKHENNTLVLGSRFFDKKAPFKSRFGNFMARASFLFSTHHKIYDTQTGLRAFNSNLLERMIAIKGDRYEYEMNVLLDAVRSDITVSEVKIETIYVNDNAGTHYNPFKDTMKIFFEVLKFSAASFAGFLVDFGLFTLFTWLAKTFFVDPTTDAWQYWIIGSNISARIISASVNFTLNYIFVFRSKKKVWKALLEYAALAAFVLAVNTTFVWLLTSKAGMYEVLAKIIVEGTMFIVSWIIQRLFVFRKKKKE